MYLNEKLITKMNDIGCVFDYEHSTCDGLIFQTTDDGLSSYLLRFDSWQDVADYYDASMKEIEAAS